LGIEMWNRASQKLTQGVVASLIFLKGELVLTIRDR
jgi:hypothetical protein